MALATTLDPNQFLADMIDEVKHQESKSKDATSRLQESLAREKQWTACCEALVSYVTSIEQRILLPSLGNLADALKEYKEVEQKRNEGVRITSATINASSSHRLAALFALMEAPSHTSAHFQARQQEMTGPTDPAAIENAYVLMATLQGSRDRLSTSLRDAGAAAARLSESVEETVNRTAELERAHAEAQKEVARLQSALSSNNNHNGSNSPLRRHGTSFQSAASASALSGADPADLQRIIDTQKDSIAALQQEVDFLSQQQRNQSNPQNTFLMTQKQQQEQQQHEEEKAALANRLESVTRQLRASQVESEQLQRQAAAAQNLRDENRVLSDRVQLMQNDIARFEQERAEVQKHFLTVQQELMSRNNGSAPPPATSNAATFTSQLQPYPNFNSSSNNNNAAAAASSPTGSFFSGGASPNNNLIRSAREGELETELRAAREAESELRDKLDTLRRESATKQAKLERDLADYKRRVTLLQEVAPSSSGGAAAGGESYALSADEADDAFLRQILGSTRSGGGGGGGRSRSNASGGGGDDNDGFLEAALIPHASGGSNRSRQSPLPTHTAAKIKAYEMTIESLNAEFAQFEERIVQLQRTFEEEKQTLLAEHSGEREAWQAERLECDQIMAKLNDEMETLMQENEQLRKRMSTYVAARAGTGVV